MGNRPSNNTPTKINRKSLGIPHINAPDNKDINPNILKDNHTMLPQQKNHEQTIAAPTNKNTPAVRTRKGTNDSIRDVIGKGSIGTNYIVKEDVVLGRGHYAYVNPAIHRQSGKEVAVKRIQISKSRVQALKSEIEILTRVGRHPNIVELYDIYITDTEVQLVMELLKGGELFDRMIEKGPYSELEASVHIGNIGRALKYLHGEGIVHRDLKPENLILVDKSDDAELKITDFGLSKIVDDIENSLMQTVCGTWAYAAPEVKTASSMNGKVAYSYKVDLWSLGVIMFVMLSAYHPFDPDGECTDAQLWMNICKGKFDFNDSAWEGISDSAKDLISHLIVVDPEKRYGTEELLSHPWIAHVGVDVPMTPISPGIESNLRSFQKKKRYNVNGSFNTRNASGKPFGRGINLADSESDSE